MEIIARINIGENNNRYLYRLCRHDSVLVWQFHGYVWSYSEYLFELNFSESRKIISSSYWRLTFEPQDLEAPL